MEYFNGLIDVNVSDIDCLNSMTQDMANAIATGPQDGFFEVLDSFNQELTHYGIEPIDVTNKWNWKPGTSKKIIEFQTNRLQLSKTHGGIVKQFDRTRERANWMSYIRNQASRLEQMKYELKRAGVSKNVDIAEFQQRTIDLVKVINDQCSLVKDLTEGKVIMTPFISNDFNSRATPFYLDIILSGLTMSIYSGNKEIQQIPLQDIHLIFKYPFRHYVNAFTTRWEAKGNYGEFIRNQMFKFPYISSNSSSRRNGDRIIQYGNVCLDSYNDDIKRSFLNKDYIQMSMHLMNWAQYYSTTHSNPYNPTSWLHLGIPEDYSSEYKHTISGVAGNCHTRISSSDEFKWVPGTDVINYSKNAINPCESINCQLQSECGHFLMHWNRVEEIEQLSDKYCQIESMIGFIVDTLENHDTPTYQNYMDILDYNGFGYYYFKEIDTIRNTEEENSNLYLDLVIPELIMYWVDKKDGYQDDLFYLITGSSSFDWGYPKEIVKEEDNTDEDDIKRAMLEWATNPERSR